MSTEPSSLMGALQDAAGDNTHANQFMPDVEQLDLLRDAKGKLPNDALRQVRMQNRGRGRPPGARNKRSEDVAKWFIQRFGDPLTALGEIMNTPEDVLYEQMVLAQGGESKNKRVTGKDAKDFRLRAILEAMPYVHQRRPIAIEHSGKTDAVIFIPGLNAPLGFSQEELTRAVEAMGAEAIEAAGIRLIDGSLVEPPAGDGEPK